jgi:hypothetical protein
MAASALGAGVFCGVFGGCSSAEKLQGQGGVCFTVSDCQEGLACVPQKDGSRICSSDLTPIQMAAEAGGTMPEAAVDGAVDGGSSDATAPADSPMPVDTGTAPMDTGAPPADTGTPPEAATGGDSGGD